MRFATLRNYLAFLRSHGIRWDDNAREVLWCGLSKVWRKEEGAMNASRTEERKREGGRERGAFVTRERKSLRNRCPSGQKAFIVLFRSYGRRHKRGRPNSYGCRFVQRTRPIANRENRRPTLLLLLDRNPMKLLRNTRPVRHFTSLRSLETVETSLKRIGDKKETWRCRGRGKGRGCGGMWEWEKERGEKICRYLEI